MGAQRPIPALGFRVGEISVTFPPYDNARGDARAFEVQVFEFA
jgi:hypothetical protein